MIKINVTTPLSDLRGVEMKENGDSVLVRDVIVSSVLYTEKDKHVSPTEKYALYKISRKTFDAESEVEYSNEEVEIIKDSVGLLYAPLVVGQVFELLGL